MDDGFDLVDIVYSDSDLRSVALYNPRIDFFLPKGQTILFDQNGSLDKLLHDLMWNYVAMAGCSRAPDEQSEPPKKSALSN